MLLNCHIGCILLDCCVLELGYGSARVVSGLPAEAVLHKLSHSSYMFRHYCVILREIAVSNLPSYTSMSNAVVGNII